MSLFTPHQEAAARRAIELNLPFALFALPGESSFRFYASEPRGDNGNFICGDDLGHRVFFITPFCMPVGVSLAIRDDLTPEQVLALSPDTEPWPPSELTPTGQSTPFAYYAAMVHRAVGEIKRHRFDKVVLSRLIAATTRRHPVELAEEYFASLPDTFRAIYFTPETGLWVTATPELLLSDLAIPRYDADGNLIPPPDPSQPDYVMPESQFESMALAGTRPGGDTADWDDKNIAEHDTVVRFITSVFTENGLDPEVTEEEPVTFGSIEHKLHRIRGRGTCNSLHLLDELSPTPALAGWPMLKVLPFIAKAEQHRRDCYGGVIGTLENDELRAWVNIRCAMLASEADADGRRDVNIFAGGGIMASSDYRSEWEEAARKAMPLYSLIDPDGAPAIAEIPPQWRTF